MEEARPHHGARQRRIGCARSVRREVLRQKPQADEKGFLLPEVAQGVEHVLDRRVRREHPPQASIKIRVANRCCQEIAIDHRIEHMRAADDDLRKPRRAAEKIGEQFAQTGIGLEDRQQFDGGAALSQRMIERG